MYIQNVYIQSQGSKKTISIRCLVTWRLCSLIGNLTQLRPNKPGVTCHVRIPKSTWACFLLFLMRKSTKLHQSWIPASGAFVSDIFVLGSITFYSPCMIFVGHCDSCIGRPSCLGIILSTVPTIPACPSAWNSLPHMIWQSWLGIFPFFWLVVYLPLWNIYVNRDDEIPNIIYGKNKCSKFQTTNIHQPVVAFSC